MQVPAYLPRHLATLPKEVITRQSDPRVLEAETKRGLAMEGFGNADYITPLTYGSVQDGLTTNPSIEHMLKKTYWKTKQTVIKKLKKPEDSFVVAGDSDIDAKLERAENLQSSCHELLQALARTSYHTRAISSYELSLGEYLSAYSESELTYAGSIMKKTGELHEQHAKMRMKTVPPMIRLHQEFCTFSNNAISDLNESIRRLEKSRVDYRAALLWMKNVSEKLHDPDQRNQLARFREAQATVKQTKEYFEKMKRNLMEKIEMVSASRCNLLSHTLPSYQTETLQYLDHAAVELHKLTVALRTQTQHQYKVKSFTEEIRGLESGEKVPSESPPPAEPSSAPDVEEPSKQEDSSSSEEGRQEADKPLIDMLQDELFQSSSCPPPDLMGGEETLIPPTGQPTTAEDKKELEESESQQDTLTAESEMARLMNLLDIDDQPPAAPTTDENGSTSPTMPHSGTATVDKWDQFSSFMDSPAGNESDYTGWEKEVLQTNPQTAGSLSTELEELFAADSELESLADPTTASSTSCKSEEMTFDPLLEPTKQVETATAVQDVFEPSGSSGLEKLGLDSSLFSQPQQSPLVPPAAPIAGALPLSLPPLPSHSPLPMGTTTSTMAGKPINWNRPQGSISQPSTESTSEDKKKKPSWMNVFAHLDPIANEKA